MLIIILAVLLALTLGYIGLSEYNKMKSQKELSIFQQGVKSGSDQTLLYLFQQGLACQSIPLFINNQTLTMIPIECVYNQALTCEPLAVKVGGQTLNLIATQCLENSSNSRN